MRRQAPEFVLKLITIRSNTSISQTATDTFQRLLAHVKARLCQVVDETWAAAPDVHWSEHRLQEDADGLPPFVMGIKKLLVTRTKNTLTIVAGWPQRHIQFVLRHHPCAASVLVGFGKKLVNNVHVHLLGNPWRNTSISLPLPTMLSPRA